MNVVGYIVIGQGHYRALVRTEDQASRLAVLHQGVYKALVLLATAEEALRGAASEHTRLLDQLRATKKPPP